MKTEIKNELKLMVENCNCDHYQLLSNGNKILYAGEFDDDYYLYFIYHNKKWYEYTIGSTTLIRENKEFEQSAECYIDSFPEDFEKWKLHN